MKNKFLENLGEVFGLIKIYLVQLDQFNRDNSRRDILDKIGFFGGVLAFDYRAFENALFINDEDAIYFISNYENRINSFMRKIEKDIPISKGLSEEDKEIRHKIFRRIENTEVRERIHLLSDSINDFLIRAIKEMVDGLELQDKNDRYNFTYEFKGGKTDLCELILFITKLEFFYKEGKPVSMNEIKRMFEQITGQDLSNIHNLLSNRYPTAGNSLVEKFEMKVIQEMKKIVSAHKK